ncbi:hypothetical protein LCGC14_2253070, partial [marine sediment metagenome]
MKIEKKILFDPRDLWVGVYLNNVVEHSAPAEMMTLTSVSPYVFY